MNFAKWLCAGIMLVTVGGFAQSPKEKLVEEMLVLSGTPDTLKNVTEQIMQMQTQMINQRTELSAAKKEKLVAFQQKILQKIMAFLGWENMKNDYIALYAEVYNEEELTALINFLKSPAGRKMVQKNPQLMQKAMTMMMQKMQQLTPELEKMTKEFAQEMVKDEQAAPPPATAPAAQSDVQK